MVLLYGIFSGIDYAIYSVVRFVVRLIILIANANFFNDDAINDVASKVYVILGVLVLFKIVISCVQYIVNPDTFDDKDKGLVGLLKKAVISMALLAVIQPVFRIALELQNTVVSTIPGLILGQDTLTSSVKLDDKSKSQSFRDTLDKISDKVAGTTIWSFVELKSNDAYKKANNKSIPSMVGNIPVRPPLDTETNTVELFRERVTLGCGSLLTDFSGQKCYFEYRVLLSTAAGLFLLYVLVSMALDVGIRTIKLGILQILAPIPIGSYIVSKDKLSKFAKLAGKVYADLFIRLGVIYFIIFFVQRVIDGFNSANVIPNYSAEPIEVAFIKVMIIIALFMFAKNAPKFICEVLGIDGGGFGDMKDMFTRAGGLAGTTMAGFRTARSNYTAQKERALGKNPDSKVGARLRGALSAAAGFGSATGRGFAMMAQGKGFKDVKQGANKAALNARNRRIDRADKLYNTGVPKYIEEDILDENGNPKLDMNGNKMTRKVKNPEYYGYMDYHRDVKREKLGIPSSEGFVKARYDAMESIAKMASDAKGHGVGKMNETPDKYKINLASEAGDAGRLINGSLGFNELTMEQVRNMYQMAKNGQEITTENRDPSGNRIVRKLTDDEITVLGSLVQNIEKRTSYLKEAELMATGDPAATPNAEKLRIGIQTNKDMFSSQDIIGPIREKLLKDIGSSIIINNETIDVSKLDYNGLVNITSHLQHKIDAPAGSDEYNATVRERANILLGLKDAFEEVSKLQYRGAQIADNRAQKAQQAISNNDKKS